MPKTIFWKAALRRPVQTLGLLLLCAGAAFAFLTEVLQAAVLSDAVKELEGYYRAIGSFRALSGDPDQHDVTACVQAIEGDARVALLDVRRYGTYTMDDHFTADSAYECFDPSIAACYLQGTCSSAEIREGNYEDLFFLEQDPAGNWSSGTAQSFSYQLTVTVREAEILTGLPAAAPVTAGSLSVFCYSSDRAELEAIAAQAQTGETVLFHTCYTVGSRSYFLRLLPLGESGVWFCPLGEGSADDALSELKGVEEERELLAANIRSSVFFTTRDMSAMAGLNDRFALVEGRYLTALDDAEAAPVCVIRTELAASAGLAVGDRLSLRVWDLRYPGSAIRPDLEGAPLSQLPSTRLELTVVGIVHNLSQARAGEGWRGEIYLPESTVPETYDRLDFLNNSWTTVVLRSMEERDGFLRDYGALFRAQGWELSWEENGWNNFAAAAGPLRQSALLAAVLFGGLALLVMTLVSVLYRRSRRRELAVLRSLGCPAGPAVFAAAAPPVTLGALGILLGSGAACAHGMDRAARTLQGLAAEQPLAVDFPVAAVSLATGALILFLLLGTVLSLRRQAGHALLRQLQGKG